MHLKLYLQHVTVKAVLIGGILPTHPSPTPCWRWRWIKNTSCWGKDKSIFIRAELLTPPWQINIFPHNGVTKAATKSPGNTKQPSKEYCKVIEYQKSEFQLSTFKGTLLSAVEESIKYSWSQGSLLPASQALEATEQEVEYRQCHIAYGKNLDSTKTWPSPKMMASSKQTGLLALPKSSQLQVALQSIWSLWNPASPGRTSLQLACQNHVLLPAHLLSGEQPSPCRWPLFNQERSRGVLRVTLVKRTSHALISELPRQWQWLHM